MKILLVDDHDDLMMLWSRFLAPLEAEIIIVRTMREAMEAMREIPPPDIVFLDLVLPDMANAEATLAHISQIKEQNPNAVVIVVTGRVCESIGDTAMALGADDFKMKLQMKSQDSLLRVVKSALEIKVKRGASPVEASQRMIERLGALLSVQVAS